MNPPTYLAKKNPHPRDKCISFDEGPHIYTINGDSDFMSVTKWNHSHFEPFDPDKIIDKMIMSRRWGPAHKHWGKTPAQIKKEWKDNGIAASTAGTKMHYDIECYYNDQEVEIDLDCVEWDYFMKFEDEMGQDMKPYRTEWMIWDAKLKFAGSIDMLFENPDGSLEIYDWKRSVGIKKENRWQSSTTPCISHLPDSNYWHYCLQLNTYKALLERNYGKKVKGMYLICLHPNNENKSYQRIPVEDLQKEVKDLFALRRLMLKEKALKNVTAH